MLREVGHEEAQLGDQFGLLVSCVVDYAIFMLDPDGTILTWNQGAQRIKGYAADEIIGRHFSTFYPADSASAGKPQWELDVARRDGRYEEEGWRIRKDGSRFWASVVITALRDRNGELRGFGKVTRDLTDRHLQEVELETSRRRESAQLRAHADRMAELERTKAEFLNLASHELRGPLTVVRGYNSMFEDGSIGGADIPPVARIIEGKLAQMELLIEQMLETARLEDSEMALQLKTVDLAALLSHQVQSLRPLARGRNFVVEGIGCEVLVEGDRSRIATVIGNLLDNAVKYSMDGDVRCTVGRDEWDAFIEVTDRGVGIAPEHPDRIFTRFGRVPTAENVSIPGVGLGLFLCREIARRHGGDVTVASVPGAGSTFRFEVPALEV